MSLQAVSDYDVWADIADAYRKGGAPWPGRKAADPKRLVEAMVAVEDELEFTLSRNQPKQAARISLRTLRRVLECRVYP